MPLSDLNREQLAITNVCNVIEDNKIWPKLLPDEI